MLLPSAVKCGDGEKDMPHMNRDHEICQGHARDALVIVCHHVFYRR
jgi:hypothetical protein